MFVNGALPEHNIDTHPLHCDSWHRANNLVLSWLINYIFPAIRDTLLYLVNAKDV